MFGKHETPPACSHVCEKNYMFEAFILAGGRSSRMHREKALVELNKESLLRRSARIISESGATRTTVLTGEKARILKTYFDDLTLLDDISPGLGASGGILTAIEHSDEEDIFIHACDLPFITPDLVKFLKNIFTNGGYDAVVPMQPDSFKQPLCAFYRKSTCIVPFRAKILRSDLTPSVRDLLDTVNTKYVDFDEISHLDDSSDFFLNINTPMDLDFARKIERAK
jgi:molybdopterin-guanine dinucleotide biosynthesis protein A